MKHGMQNLNKGRPRGNRPPSVMGTRLIVEVVARIMRLGPFSAAC
jgi:hypothetical protein